MEHYEELNKLILKWGGYEEEDYADWARIIANGEDFEICKNLETQRALILKEVKKAVKETKEPWINYTTNNLCSMIMDLITFDKANALYCMKIVRNDPNCPNGFPWITEEDFNANISINGVSVQDICWKDVHCKSSISSCYIGFAELNNFTENHIKDIKKMLTPEFPHWVFEKKSKAFVLNLKRRPDRLERFQKFYGDFGPNIPLTVFEAVDGSDSSQISRVPESILKSLSPDNDFNNKPSISCTMFSHMMIWKEIAEGTEDYGIVFEDDCFFRPNNNKLPEISCSCMKRKWSKVIKDYEKELEKPKSILFFGCGDLLPIHTCPPSESMLIAQESNHVLKPLSGKYFGKPNFNSPYVFSWIGLGGYVLSKIQAKYLLAVASRKSITCAVDAWIKGLSEKGIVDIYFTVPLFAYFPNILDSNTSFPEKGYI